MPGSLFVDTNVLVYAHDLNAGRKHQQAKAEVSRLWKADHPPCISVQVLQELFVNLRRLGVAPDVAEEVVLDYSSWHVVNNTLPLFEAGLDSVKKWGISLWDGLIIAAARECGADTILSEDLSPKQDYGGLRVVNPFA